MYLDYGNPKHKYRLDNEWTESSLKEKDLRMLLSEKLNISRQREFAGQLYPGLQKQRDGLQVWELITPLLCHLQATSCIQFWGLQHKKYY